MTPFEFYTFVAPFTTLVLRLAPSITKSLPRRWQWVPAVVIAGLLEAVACAGLGRPWVEVGLAGLLAALTAGPGAIGLHHAVKRLVPPPPTEVEVVRIELKDGQVLRGVARPVEIEPEHELREVEVPGALAVTVTGWAYETP